MGGDGYKIVFGNLGKHFANCSANIFRGLAFSCRTAEVHALIIALHVLSEPSFGIPLEDVVLETVSELITCEFNDAQGEVVPHAVNMMGDLLRVKMRSGFRFCLGRVSKEPTQRSAHAYRNIIHVKISLPALFLAPGCKFRVAGGDEAKARGWLVIIGRLQRHQHTEDGRGRSGGLQLRVSSSSPE